MVVVTERRRSGMTWIPGLGVLAASGSFILVATSAHLAPPTAYAVHLALLILGATGAALVWRARRRGNRLDVILLAIAAAAVGISLQGVSQPVVHSIGVLFDPLVFALGYYLALAFPEARLDGTVARTLFGAIVGITLFSFIPWFFFSPYVSGGAPLARCTAACPQNGLMIADRPSIANSFGHAEELLGAGIVAAIAVYLVARLIAAPRPRRRALVPVYVPTLFLAIPYVIFHLAQAGVIQVAAVDLNRIGWLVTVGRTTLALGPAFAVVVTTYFAGRALKGIVERLGASPSVAELRSMVADALDDPTLELAFGIGPGGGLFVDTRGNPLTPALLASTTRT